MRARDITIDMNKARVAAAGQRAGRALRGVAGATALGLAALGLAGLASPPATAAPVAVTAATATAATATAASVTVNANSGLGTIPASAIGLNTAVYDGYMNDTPIPGLLKAAGIDALRYPGGSYSDIYNWQTNVAQGGYDAPGTNFSDFMATAQAGRGAAHHHRQLRHRHPGPGRRLGQGRRRHQQRRHPVLGGRQRGLRQRHLRVQLGDRLAL